MRQTRRIRKNRKRKSRGGAWPWSASTPENDANEIVKLSQNLSKENVQKIVTIIEKSPQQQDLLDVIRTKPFHDEEVKNLTIELIYKRIKEAAYVNTS